MIRDEKFFAEDFVQIAHWGETDSGKLYQFMRNALYCSYEGGRHNVIYSDGTKEALDDRVVIERVSDVNESILGDGIAKHIVAD